MPILLLIIYGVLEVGRVIFTFSIVASASREAARYGSATGLNIEGVPRYQDCAGIRAAAQAPNVDFLGVIADSNIVIQYDHGPTTPVYSGSEPPIKGYPLPFATCTDNTFSTTIPVQSRDRIVVLVRSQFAPLAAIVRLSPMTIRSASARTIIGKIIIPP
jgi:Flp pilus assembly protein TadG